MTPERLADVRTIVQVCTSVLNHVGATRAQRIRAAEALARAVREIRAACVEEWVEPIRLPHAK